MVDILKKRRKYLDKLINGIMKKIAELPSDNLYSAVNRSRNNIQYYSVSNSDTKNRKYLSPTTDLSTIKALADKKYLNKALKAAIAEKDMIDKMMNFYDKSDLISDVYTNLGEEEKKITNSYLLSDDEYVKWWQSQPYERKAFRDDDDTDYVTDRGERVRSKSEMIIANALFKLNIPYRYECKLMLKNGIEIYPDFTILKVKTREECYLEHNGRMGLLDYQNDFCERMNLYAENDIIVGKNLFLTFESGNCPLKMGIITKTLRQLFENGEKHEKD